MTASGTPADADLAALRRGDRAAFGRLVDAHRSEVYRTVVRILGHPQDSEDAAQEVFLRAWRALPGFRGDSAVRTWLTRIAIHVALSRRSAGRLRAAEGDVDRLPDESIDGDRAVELREAVARVRRAVDRLPPRQRAVVALKVFDERPHAEVAQILGITPGAVKAHLHQAVANLRVALGEADRAPRVKET